MSAKNGGRVLPKLYGGSSPKKVNLFFLLVCAMATQLNGVYVSGENQHPEWTSMLSDTFSHSSLLFRAKHQALLCCGLLSSDSFFLRSHCFSSRTAVQGAMLRRICPLREFLGFSASTSGIKCLRQLAMSLFNGCGEILADSTL